MSSTTTKRRTRIVDRRLSVQPFVDYAKARATATGPVPGRDLDGFAERRQTNSDLERFLGISKGVLYRLMDVGVTISFADKLASNLGRHLSEFYPDYWEWDTIHREIEV